MLMQRIVIPVQADHPAFIRQLHTYAKSDKIHSMSALVSPTFAFLDVETTGLSSWFGNPLCEIALLCCLGQEILGIVPLRSSEMKPVPAGDTQPAGCIPFSINDPR
jgi:hypothetical protein